MRSLIHEIPGLPKDYTDIRWYLLTSWTLDGINEARKKSCSITGMGEEDILTEVQVHYGMSGDDGDQWHSCLAFLPISDMNRNIIEQTEPRYGLERWVWTDDENSSNGKSN